MDKYHWIEAIIFSFFATLIVAFGLQSAFSLFDYHLNFAIAVCFSVAIGLLTNLLPLE